MPTPRNCCVFKADIAVKSIAAVTPYLARARPIGSPQGCEPEPSTALTHFCIREATALRKGCRPML